MALRHLLALGLLAVGGHALAQEDTLRKDCHVLAATKTSPSTTLLATSTGTSNGLNEAAQAAGKMWFGTAISIPGPEEDNEHYLSVFRNSKDFGQATPANSMKFAATERRQGKFDFTRAEGFLRRAEDKKIRCHALIWHRSLPQWLEKPKLPWTNETLSAVLVEHVQTLVRHFGDTCYSWDVVNEAISDDQPRSGAIQYRGSIWSRVIGPEFVAMAFRAAQKVVNEDKLHVKLYYSDYGIEEPGAKSTATQLLVKQLKDRGIRVDGIGLQSHFAAGTTPSQQQQERNMRDFLKLGVEVAITELDVRVQLPPTVADQRQQSRDYYDTVSACVHVEKCVGVTVWGIVDDASWIPRKFAGSGFANLFFRPTEQSALVKKAAYDACLGAMKGQPAP
ncbi:Beta-xylanase [Cercospora zeina]